MRFSDAFLDEIRQRLDIHEVVGEHVIWDKGKSQPGRGDYWACCPFHGEKTPSFHADDRRGIYHCFGCGATGDHFRFLTELTGASFPEAVERLAQRAGVPLPARDAHEEAAAATRRARHDVLDLAAHYFEAALAHTIGARARGYLFERGVSPAAQTRFRLGYAPDSRNGLKEHLAQNGVSAEAMAESGLVVSAEGNPLPFDRFRNRVMFPISDLRGKIIGFGGRALSADVPAKYLNSPETPLFKKRQTLYNGQSAREAAHKGQALIVVEGYLDVIAAVSVGFEGALAPLGTALTDEHLQLLWTMADAPILCFDGDAAGQRAQARVAELALPLLTPGKTVGFALLPDGLDPDDLIRARGRDAFARVLASARGLAETIWALETGGLVPEAPEARAALEVRLKGRAGAIADPSVRRHYLQAFDERLAAFFRPVHVARGGDRRTGRPGPAAVTRPGGRPAVSETLRNSRLLRGGPSAREAVILIGLVNHPRLAEARLEMLAALEFRAEAARALLGAVIEAVLADHDVTPAQLRRQLAERGLDDELTAMEAQLTRLGVWQVLADAASGDAEIGLKHAMALHYRSVELNRALKAAQSALDAEWTEESFKALQDIKYQIATLEGTEALIEGFGSLSGRATRGL